MILNHCMYQKPGKGEKAIQKKIFCSPKRIDKVTKYFLFLIVTFFLEELTLVNNFYYFFNSV